jgi:biopolymer transport protein ExbB/biopolymer transport protein TolQ
MGWIAKGVVLLLAVMSVITVAVAIDRVLAVIRPRAKGRLYSEAVQKHLDKGDFEQAAKVPTTGAGPMAQVVSAGVAEYLDARTEAPTIEYAIVAVESTLARTVDVETAKLRRGLGALATIGSTSPFIGLFGTVVGIVNAFRQIARTGSGGLGAVSAGIAEALVTTAFGILVAIPAVVLFNYFTGQVDALSGAMTQAASVVVDFVRKAGWAGTRASSKEAA